MTPTELYRVRLGEESSAGTPFTMSDMDGRFMEPIGTEEPMLAIESWRGGIVDGMPGGDTRPVPFARAG